MLTMANEGQRLVRLIAELETLNDQLREALAAHRQALAEAAGLVDGGALSAEVIRAAGAAEIRMSLTDALEAFERSRHRVRVAMFGFLATDPDTSTADIGRTLGISRQLASRLAHEADRQTDDLVAPAEGAPPEA